MKILAAELTGQIAVGVAWLLLVALPTHADPATGDARSAAPAARAAPAAAPSVLLLPPRLPPQAGRAARAEADAACDRLAQDLAAAGLARVVDRTQIDRVLQERNLRPELPRPMLSYDAMIRLEADTTRLAPGNNARPHRPLDGQHHRPADLRLAAQAGRRQGHARFLPRLAQKDHEAGRGQAAGPRLWVDGRHPQRADEAAGRTADRGLRRVAAAVRARRARPPPGGRHGQRGIAAVADGAEPVAGREAIHASGRRHDRAPRRRGRRPAAKLFSRRRWKSACGSARGPATRATG